MRIDLVIDAAASPLRRPAGQVRHPALERLIARGDAFALNGSDLQSCLLALFALPSGTHLPAAALSLLGDGIDPGNDDWLRLDPVHLRADRTRLLFVPLPPGEIEPAEAAALQAVLGPLLAQWDHELVAAHGRWYLRSRRPLDLRTEPPPRTPGALDERQLPQGVDGAAIRRLITEAQMLLHTLPMNESREACGKPAVNGLWPWGNGRLEALGGLRYSHAFSDDPIVRGIARAAGAVAASLAADGDDLVSGLPADSSLLVLGSANGSLAEVERRWAAPLTSQLQRGLLNELRVVLIGQEAVLARSVWRRQLLRWWRRPRPLEHA